MFGSCERSRARLAAAQAARASSVIRADMACRTERPDLRKTQIAI
jgi:hypothetical protein